MAAPPPGQFKDAGAKKGFRRYRWEFKDSNREFWVNGHAMIKLLTLACMIAGLQLFETVVTHPILILVLTMEVAIIAFFIFLYSFAINRYLPFIFWPITEIFNDLFAFVFLVGGIVFAAKARRVMPPPYLAAVVLMGVAAIFSIIDLCLQKKHLKGKKIRKGALGQTGLGVLMETVTKEEEMAIRRANEAIEREERERRKRERRR
ncbi:CKLF-like MARVEL transmembrane domain-containing protein 2A [Mesocricetus auratus]|uniref:CKLF-like MARVEL transmembrane domain-containing protein 2A n=1 Tax=Mesocricetus auratus TaxID=10036 RepID=A0ABM2X7L5_MESAU|nr:CKLF-like MARVEL transmembrane domain-containing protein 2A [Mesocricetus auratus]